MCLSTIHYRPDEAIAASSRAVEVFRTIGPRQKLAEALGRLAEAYSRQGEFVRARVAIDEAVSIARAENDTLGLRVLLRTQRVTQPYSLDPIAQQRLSDEMRAIDPRPDPFSLAAQAWTEAANARPAEARTLLLQAIELYERWPAVYADNQALGHLELAWQSLLLGDASTGATSALRALRIATDAGLALVEIALYTFAHVAALRGDSERAALLLGFSEGRIPTFIDNGDLDIQLKKSTRDGLASSLTPERFSVIYARGAALSKELAVELALGP